MKAFAKAIYKKIVSYHWTTGSFEQVSLPIPPWEVGQVW